MAKTLQELEFKDNFMFSATMLDPENCRLVLERILEFPIERVEVSREKSIVYHPEYKGVRLDVYANDENNTRYDVEMQVGTSAFLKRARYYHSSMDMDLIETGVNYNALPRCYVIFICDTDPFGLKKYRYTRKCLLSEAHDYDYDDGTYTIFLSTQGTNDREVPKELVNFLKYVGNSDHSIEDPLVDRLKDFVSKIKSSREMEGRYMLFEELQEQNYQRGFEEGELKGELKGAANIVVNLLCAKGTLPENAADIIMNQISVDNTNVVVKMAIEAESVESFFESLLSM